MCSRTEMATVRGLGCVMTNPSIIRRKDEVWGKDSSEEVDRLVITKRSGTLKRNVHLHQQ